jgi:transposase
MDKVIGDLKIMDTLGIKPNYSELSRKYGIDRRTIKKYHEGYEGKPKTKNKKSKLNKYKEEIIQKINLTGATIKGTYIFFKKKYKEIGTYSNFKAYVRKHNLIEPKDKSSHPRYETEIGQQLQFDWKEDIKMISKYGEIFEFNIFSATLSWSRLHIFVYSKNKTRADVERCLIEVFKYIGGMPKELLTDNMSTVVDLITKDGVTTKKINPEFKQFVNDMGTTIKTCKTRKPMTKRKS